jgi:hypothetical protein
MALALTPKGLTPVNMQGGAPYNGGSIRQIVHSADVARAFGVGCLVQMVAGNPVPAAATPVGPDIVGGANATAGIVGVCVGISYTDPAQGQPLFGQYLPANAVTAGYKNVRIYVCDDPNQLFLLNTKTEVGAKVGGARSVIGLNVGLTDVADVNAVTGVSKMVADTGADWATPAATSTLAMRIVDVVEDTVTHPFPELVVKFNAGVHAYNNSLGG